MKRDREAATSKRLSVSVAMCTFNGARYLDEQLSSIVGQTELPDELVVSDDQSSDQTATIIENWRKAAPFPIRWSVNARRLGSTANFERALHLCKGDLLALSDQDDIWKPTKLASARSAFDREPSLLAYFTDAEIVDDQLAPLGRRLWASVGFSDEIQTALSHDAADAEFLERSFVTGATMVIRRELAEFAAPFPTSLPMHIHDRWLALHALAFGKLGADPNPSVLYRQHADQQIGAAEVRRPSLNAARRPFWDQMEAELDALDMLLERIRNIPGETPRREFLEALDDRMKGLAFRSSLRGTMRWGRIAAVLREYRSGRYHRNANGALSALKDVIVR